jgi:rfaE bifunctional protein nucleotidyltransferase chain/domain
LSRMSELMQTRRNTKRVWVLCHGVFDIVHIGHVVHLEWARDRGDRLIVSITPDRAVQKGPGRPHFSQEKRMENIAALNCVDYVVLNEDVDATLVLSELQPDIYVKGPDIERDPTKAFLVERTYVESYGGRVAFSPDRPELHSTDLFDLRKTT